MNEIKSEAGISPVLSTDGLGAWIPIAERWPDEKVSVLVATPDGMAVCAWEWVVGRRWWVPTAVNGEYGYECGLKSHRGDNCDTAATHWMPLPEAPNVELTGDPQLHRGASSERSERG